MKTFPACPRERHAMATTCVIRRGGKTIRKFSITSDEARAMATCPPDCDCGGKAKAAATTTATRNWRKNNPLNPNRKRKEVEPSLLNPQRKNKKNKNKYAELLRPERAGR